MKARTSQTHHAQHAGQLAFSLLEVMVAVSILGLALTVILSAQGGLSASNKSAKNMGTASTMARCKMTEMEEKLLKFGYPEIDVIETEVACCDDDKDPNFTCDIKTEKVQLPALPNGDAGSVEGGTVASLSLGDGGIVDNTTPSANPNTFALPGATAIPSGAFTGFGAIDLDAGVSGLGSQVSGQLASMGGAEGLLTTVMGIVYPGVKYLMEAAIRRLTVKVNWKEGGTPRSFLLTQYVTNPANGGFNGDAGLGDAGQISATPGPVSPTNSPAGVPTLPTAIGRSGF